LLDKFGWDGRTKIVVIFGMLVGTQECKSEWHSCVVGLSLRNKLRNNEVGGSTDLLFSFFYKEKKELCVILLLRGVIDSFLAINPLWTFVKVIY